MPRYLETKAGFCCHTLKNIFLLNHGLGAFKINLNTEEQLEFTVYITIY